HRRRAVLGIRGRVAADFCVHSGACAPGSPNVGPLATISVAMYSNAPTVSVIVRSMARPSLQAALASIAAQDFPAIEVVVVAASGSSHPPLPGTCGVHPLRLVTSAARLPRPAAANAGLDHATGEWITFLDDDDIFLPGHISALMAACAEAKQARLIHSYACAVFRDGQKSLIGQPHALARLYAYNYIHLSTTVFARELVAEGCRFDESFDLLEDWDFVLQLAQRSPFYFVPVNSFEWHVEAGDSGMGMGVNRDASRYVLFRDRIFAKWAAARDALAERVAPHLQLARTLIQSGQWQEAETKCREVLAASPNDPLALHVLAIIKRGVKDLSGARVIQELAVAICPQDVRFIFNLAVLCRDQDDIDSARRCCDRALSLDPEFAPAQRLRAELSSLPGGLNRGR
ncbi:MAG: glycosyltransferase, partial [Gallionellaceae bacterium]